ncbi:uncharacterized protein O9250_009850 [Rhynochetos jubatus]
MIPSADSLQRTSQGSSACDVDPQALLQALKDMDDVEGVSVPAVEKQPLSSPPASRQYKKLNLEGSDDPLAGLLPERAQDAPKKPVPTGTEKKPAWSQEREPAQTPLRTVAPVKKRVTFEDDGGDLLDAMGFGSGSKREEKQGKKADEEEVRAAALLGRSSVAKLLEQPSTGERREFKLGEKSQKQPEKEEGWHEEDFVFGTYQPTVASLPRARLTRRQPARLPAEDVTGAKGSSACDVDPQALLQALKDMDDVERVSVPAVEKQPLSSPPASRQYKKLNLEGSDDPLAGLLPERAQDAPKKPVPTGTEKKPAWSQEREPAQTPLRTVAPVKKRVTFEDDGGDLLDAMGFGSGSKREEKQGKKADEEEVRAAALLGRSSVAKLLEQPSTGERREFKLGEKSQKQPEKEEGWHEEDFVFGTYQPTVASLPRARLTRRQPARLPAEDVTGAKGSSACDVDPQALLQALKDMDDVEGVSVPAVEKQPLSSPPASRQYKKLNLEGSDDPLAGLLPERAQDAPKKPVPTGTEKKPAWSQEREPAQTPLRTVAPVKKRVTFEDDGGDLLDAMGFGSGSKREEKQGKKADEEEVRAAALLGRSSVAKLLEQPSTGERREFKLGEKSQKQPEKEEGWHEEDFVFGTYQPTVASLPRARLTRRQPARLPAEDVTGAKGSSACDVDPQALLQALKDMDDVERVSVPAVEKQPLSSPPASRQYKKLNLEGSDDPLAGLLPERAQDAPKKPVPTGTEKKPAWSQEREPAQTPLRTVAPVKKRVTFEDDGGDLLDAMGFGSGSKREEKQGKKADEEEVRAAALLGRSSVAKLLEQPSTGERREFKLGEKSQKQPEKEEGWHEEDFVFGTYQPTVASLPRARLTRRQPAR